MTGRFLAIVLAATLLSACASTATVKTDFDPKAQFGNFRSYNWITSESGSESVMPQSVVAGIDSRLQAAGWKRVAEGDVHVAAHVTRVQGQTFNNFYSGIGHDLNWLGIGSGGQVGGGVSGMLNKRLSIYADVAWQQNTGTAGWKNWLFSGGLRYAFGGP